MPTTTARRPRRLAAGVTTAVVLGAAAVLGAAPAAAQANAGVTLTGSNTFEPEQVTVDEGGTVTFTWEGGTHNVSFDDGPMSETTGDVGNTFARTFDDAGSFDFVCTIHPTTMSGTVTVAAAAAEPTPTPPPAPTPPADDDEGDDAAAPAPRVTAPSAVPAGTDGRQAPLSTGATLAIVLGMLGLSVPVAIAVGRRR